TPTPTPTPATSTRTLSDGSTEFTDHELGYTLVLPPEWFLFSLGPEGMQAMIEAGAALNPELAPLVESTASYAAEGTRFMAFHPSPQALESGFPPSIVLITLGDLGVPIDLLLEGTALSMESTIPGAEVISYEMIDDLNGQPAGRVELRLPGATMYGTQVTARATLTIIESAGQVLELLMQCEESVFPEYQSAFEDTIQSLTVVAP
ncbi:MAG: hypothetical protein AB1449_13805, partial [Chloroflexota bacterium]